jgi:hypothetical protein
VKQGNIFLWDGRKFIITAVENGLRGYWWRATALDGKSTLQGNMNIDCYLVTGGKHALTQQAL